MVLEVERCIYGIIFNTPMGLHNHVLAGTSGHASVPEVLYPTYKFTYARAPPDLNALASAQREHPPITLCIHYYSEYEAYTKSLNFGWKRVRNYKCPILFVDVALLYTWSKQMTVSYQCSDTMYFRTSS